MKPIGFLGVALVGLGAILFLSKKEAAGEVPPEGVWQYSNLQASRGAGVFNYEGVEVYQTVAFSARVTNPGSQSATKTVQLMWQRMDVEGGAPTPSYAISLMLAPGESFVYANPTGDDPSALLVLPGFIVDLWLRDSDGNESNVIRYTAPAW